MPSVGVCFATGVAEADVRATLSKGEHKIVFSHGSLDELAMEFRERRPDLILLCLRRLDIEALSVISEIATIGSEARLILLCERWGERDVRKALDAGARAVVPLDGARRALLPVIAVVEANQVSVPVFGGGGAGRNVLTAREKQILGQVVLGMSNAEIAQKLYLAESTVKSHLSSAFAKLGVTSRNEAADLILNPASGVGLGILTIPSEKIATAR